MYVLVVKIQIKPEFRDQFMQSMIEVDAKGSVQNEPGCVRFDVIEDESDPNRIYLYEVYRDRAAFDAHLQAPHFIQWRDTVQAWYAAPTEVGRGWALFPSDADWK